jgi:hypothetical protein
MGHLQDRMTLPFGFIRNEVGPNDDDPHTQSASRRPSKANLAQSKEREVKKAIITAATAALPLIAAGTVEAKQLPDCYMLPGRQSVFQRP